MAEVKQPIIIEQVNTPVTEVLRLFLSNLHLFTVEERGKMISILQAMVYPISMLNKDEDIRLDLDKK